MLVFKQLFTFLKGAVPVWEAAVAHWKSGRELI